MKEELTLDDFILQLIKTRPVIKDHSDGYLIEYKNNVIFMKIRYSSKIYEIFINKIYQGRIKKETYDKFRDHTTIIWKNLLNDIKYDIRSKKIDNIV